jgi:hypothetical protein
MEVSEPCLESIILYQATLKNDNSSLSFNMCKDYGCDDSMSVPMKVEVKIIPKEINIIK